MRCPACGFENPSGIRFCGECGAPLKLKCRSCGFDNAFGIKFCGECGAPLTDAASSPVAVLEERRWATVLFADLVIDIPVHVGINTGEVTAGQIGPAEHRQYAVLGDTTNTASRLTSAAPPGCVLVGAETHQATHRKVRYRELAAVFVKGKQEPLAAWEALEVGAVPEARLLGTMPFVGRASELALLSQVWAKVV